MKKIFFALFLLLQIQGLYAWYGHAVVISYNKQDKKWYTLLYYTKSKKIWHDFSALAKSGQKGDEVATQALSAYGLDTIFPQTAYNTPGGPIDNGDYFHIINVSSNFKPASTIFTQVVKAKGDDLSWFALDQAIAGKIPQGKSGTIAKTTINALKQTKQKLSKPVTGDTSGKSGTFKLQKATTIDCGSFDPLSKEIKHKWPQSSVQGKSILFYDKKDPYYDFTNTAVYAVGIANYDKNTGKIHQWTTTEHYYQSQKDKDDPRTLYKKIKNKTAGQLQDFLKTYKNKRSDWNKISLQVMLKALRAKFSQHTQLKKLLLGTGNAILVENAGKWDAFYGAGTHFTGCNHLGQMLMHVRKELRDNKQYPYTPKPPKYWYDQLSGKKTEPKKKPKTSHSPAQELTNLAQSLKNITGTV